MRRMLLNDERFISDVEVKEFCKRAGIPYVRAMNYLIKYKYVKRIFRGFFYVPSIAERKLKSDFPNVYEAIARGMAYKKAGNWYFGLETAIKWSGITHEVFTIHYVVSDKIFRAKPITILGTRVKFVKLKKELTNFGIKKTKKGIPYSDLEKSLLDIIHLKKYSGKSDQNIRDYIIEWFDEADREKIKKYAKRYPKSVQEFVEGLQ
ncbi:MAG: hypothetical protein HY392_03435 [Candidatus Diapherotrites archaeon]|nr:hypothetical protein [Candidatus Diapherotrites archaeon]